MFVPGISTPSSERRKLWRRKGGGGGGRGGGGGGGKSGGSSGGSGGRSAGTISSGGTSKGVSTGGQGTRTVTTIAPGQPFAGRSEGGGTRGEIYGNRAYGSGYPGIAGKGTVGRGFPFFFWPLAFGTVGLGGAYHYHSDYGRADNSSRPGGAQQATAFISTSPETTFRLLSDETTVKSLVESVKENCGSSLANKDSISLTAYRGADQDPPQPPQIVQYYRSSSIALALDGYNNTGSFSDDESAENSPLPSNINTDLLNCLNSTIGEEAPLVDAALSMASAPSQLALLTLVGFVFKASGVL